VSQADHHDDRILEDLLRRRREEASPLGGPLCGDPELLAAFCEDALAGQAHDDMERHLASCASCREAVARLVRLAPRPAIAAAAASAPWWRQWVWAAPALAGVVLVGSFVMFNRQRIVEAPQTVAREMPLPVTPPAEKAVEPEQPPKPVEQYRAKQRPAAAPSVAAADELERLERKDKKEQVAAEARVESKADVDVQKVQTQPQQTQVRDQAPSPAAPAPPQQQQVQVFAKAPPEATPQREGAGGAAGTVGALGGRRAGLMQRPLPGSGKPEAAAAEVASNVLGDDRAKDRSDESKKLGALALPDSQIAKTVRVKNSRQTWRLMTDGRLFLSLDAGQPWKEVAVPEKVKALTARDANLTEITGISGRIYRSADAGASWILVPSR